MPKATQYGAKTKRANDHWPFRAAKGGICPIDILAREAFLQVKKIDCATQLTKREHRG